MNFDNQGVIVCDVSFYQDDDRTPTKVDFQKMKAAGAAGVIIRAGQNNWADEDFKDHWKAAKEAGLPRGSYWFYDSRTEPGKQATLWKAQIDNDLPELGVWPDLEESYGGTWKGERNWKTFIEAVHIMFPGVLVGIYTANWWWQVQQVTDPGYFGRYPLWVAQYVSHPLYVILPKPWQDGQAKLWQFTYTGDGPAYGAESLGIDLNYWNGDRESFRQFFKLGGETLPPTDGEAMYRVRSDFYNMTLRPDHNTGAVGTESLPTGTEMIADEIWTATSDLWKVINNINTKVNAVGDKWAHVVRVGAQVKNSWVAITHLGKLYCNFVEPLAEVPTITLTHTIEVYSDGSIRVDGIPYP